MRIYSMTATFGKLQGQTLTLEPGLNVITAHNEWGKSTWCAFLVAMFYGLDKRTKTTKTALAEKERYAPWSGAPMSGRIDLNWDGRDITIERFTNKRVPMGSFRAYETASGMEVPELTGENCGKLLLGVEKNVFLRSGFVRFSDLPVTDDEALRQRLNDLVTTGEESGDVRRMGTQLKELKNKIRYHQNGLLPQAEAERDGLKAALDARKQLEDRMEENQQRLDQVNDWQMLLRNHRDALEYAGYLENVSRVEAAQATESEAEYARAEALQRCQNHPSRETVAEMLQIIDHMDRTRCELEEDIRSLTEPAQPEEPATPFDGMCPEDALAIVEADAAEYALVTKKRWELFLCGLAMALLGAMLLVWDALLGGICLGVGAFVLVLDWILRGHRRWRAKLLRQQYGTADVAYWRQTAQSYALRQQDRDEQWEDYYEQKKRLQQELEILLANIEDATKGDGLDACRKGWEQALEDMNLADRLHQQWEQAKQYREGLEAMLRPVSKPQIADRMNYPPEETDRLLAQCEEEYRHLENRMHQYRGKLESMESGQALSDRLAAVESRIEKLTQYDRALTLAQTTLEEAITELQRRFAPQIAKRAQELMEQMTDGRYSRVRLSRDMTLQAGETGEDVLRQILWRSDGTVDQLYLCLRLAVSEALSPDAPLILDDALVRFDDTRLKAALEILKKEAEHKQILLFTCHGRESKMI